MTVEVTLMENSEDRYNVSGLSDYSRLQMFNIIKNDEYDYYFNIFKNYTMPDSLKNNDDLYDIYIVDNNDWWDNIAAYWYDNTELWWLICFTNDIVNPFEEIYPGKTIKIFRKDSYDLVVDELKRIYNL